MYDIADPLHPTLNTDKIRYGNAWDNVIPFDREYHCTWEKN